MKSGKDGSDDRQYPCLVRAVDGKKTMLSTCVRLSVPPLSICSVKQSTSVQVQSGALDKFHSAYGALLKSSMPKLRKRDKKREKERADRAAARKKRMLEPVKIKGSKRGKGRRKRTRCIKAFLKQEESRKKFQEREKTKLPVSKQILYSCILVVLSTHGCSTVALVSYLLSFYFFVQKICLRLGVLALEFRTPIVMPRAVSLPLNPHLTVSPVRTYNP